MNETVHDIIRAAIERVLTEHHILIRHIDASYLCLNTVGAARKQYVLESVEISRAELLHE